VQVHVIVAPDRIRQKLAAPVRAIGDPPRRTNAQAMVDCARLGYLDGWVHDCTYGDGRFWRSVMPCVFTRSDLDPAKGVPIFDFTALPYDDRIVDTMVMDGPYKLNGTTLDTGPATSDDSYGVGGAYTKIDVRMKLLADGLTECARVARSWVLFKCQDQVVSGHVKWQTRIFADHGEDCGLELWNRMLVHGYRTQPRPQVHVHSDYSTLLIFKVR
jgi:hypothetical protein